LIRRAFTLLELLIVVALLGLLAAIAWPNFVVEERSAQLDESVRRMKALVSMCRAQAMNQSCRFRVEFRQDGSVRALRQRDALEAPDEYVAAGAAWADGRPLLEEVWVESVAALPDGPAPLLVEDDDIEFAEQDIELIDVIELDQPIALDFEPHGSCGSLRWVLRDSLGRGLQMTLDGRLGRVQIAEAERIDNPQRPTKLDVDEAERDRGEDEPNRGNGS
jgi:prepilin-type N-terminal cleavage/methylation domain-containing protein